MIKIIYSIFLILFSYNLFSQVYSTGGSFESIICLHNNAIGDSREFTEYMSKIRCDSTWIGFSEKGVIYVDLFYGDSSQIRIFNRQLLEDKGLIRFDYRDSINSIIIDYKINDSTLYYLYISNLEYQWGVEYVDDYFEYTREDGFNNQIVAIEEKNKWFCGTEGTKFQPLNNIPYFR